jgi:hypothetical protein
MSPRRPLLAAAALALLTAAPLQAGDLHDVTAAGAKATVGAKGKASVTLSAKNGWKLNEQAPVTLKLTPGTGVAVDKPKLARPDLAAVSKESARFDVAFTATEPGKKTIEAEARFVICQESACKPVSQKVTVAVDVAAK